MDILRDIVAYGCLGLLVEVLFTGINSILRGNYAATSKTYLWMLPIYGIAGSIIVHVNTNIINWLTMPMRSLLNVFIIYTIEMVSGLLLTLLLGVCPWKYMDEHRPHMVHRFSILGLIRLDYAAYWFLLVTFFDYNTQYIVATLNFLSRI